MSNDDDNIIFPPGMPEEDKEKIRANWRKQHDEHLVFKHSIMHTFDSLSEDHLKTLRDLFASIDASNIQALDYYNGIMTMMLVQKFNYCLGCGAKHEDELRKLIESAAEGTLVMEPVSEPWDLRAIDQETLSKMQEYRVNIVTAEYPKVICAKCGTIYPSLEDRMLKAPDECSGCWAKDAHG